MANNQQIQNFLTALESASGVSVDADLSAESVTIEDADGNQLAIGTGGELTVSDDGDFQVQSVSVESAIIEDSTGDELDITAGGAISVDEIGSTVTVTDDGALDVNSLPEPLDVSDATVTVTDDGALAVSSLPEPLDVSGATVSVQEDTALDVSGATVTVTDDGALDVNSVSGRVDTQEQLGSAGAYGQQDVSTTAVQIMSSSADRQSLLIQNTGPEPVYVGFDSAVTASDGVEVAANGRYSDDSYSGDVYAITSSGTSDIRYQEVTA